MVYIVDASFGS